MLATREHDLPPPELRPRKRDYATIVCGFCLSLTLFCLVAMAIIGHAR